VGPVQRGNFIENAAASASVLAMSNKVSSASVLKSVQPEKARIIEGSSNVVVPPGWGTMSQISLYCLVLNSPEDIE
jgi:hypothetical protein